MAIFADAIFAEANCAKANLPILLRQILLRPILLGPILLIQLKIDAGQFGDIFEYLFCKAFLLFRIWSADV